MSLAEKYKDFLNFAPRRTNECWLGNTDTGKEIYVCGHNFLMHIKGTSFEIWKLIDGKLTVMEIVELLSQKYIKTDKSLILKDTIEYLCRMEKAGLAAWLSRPLFEDIKLDD